MINTSTYQHCHRSVNTYLPSYHNLPKENALVDKVGLVLSTIDKRLDCKLHHKQNFTRIKTHLDNKCSLSQLPKFSSEHSISGISENRLSLQLVYYLFLNYTISILLLLHYMYYTTTTTATTLT